MEEKSHLPEQVFNASESVVLWGRGVWHKGHLLVRKKNEHQDLGQERAE